MSKLAGCLVAHKQQQQQQSKDVKQQQQPGPAEQMHSASMHYNAAAIQSAVWPLW